MPLTKQETRDLYGKRARGYDLVVRLYPIFGMQLNQYRQIMVDALSLKPGDTVIDLACGTGLNFPYLQQAVGKSGHIIGVDFSDAMLDQARQRVIVSGWQNVELDQEDLALYPFPASMNAILSTYAITLVPEYDGVICRGAQALCPGGRMAIMDFKKPDHWPAWLIQFAVWLNQPFGVSLDLAVRHPWESVARYLHQIMFREFYFGAVYLSVGVVENK